MERKHPLAECERCPLVKKSCALSDGPSDAKIVVISRSPGKHESETGVVFSGLSGKVLDHLLKENGVERKDVLATNVVLCETDKPPKEAIEACKPRLFAEIEHAEIILACGTEAVALLTKKKGVHAARGYAHEYNGSRLIATFNPAAALHKPETFPDLVKDFKLALNPPPLPKLPEVRWTDDLAEAAKWARAMLQSEPRYFATDIESYGLSPRAKVACVGFSGVEGVRAVTFGESVCSTASFIRDYLRPLLSIPTCEYVGHNFKFDVRNLLRKGIEARVDGDTMLLSYVLDERPGVHSLEYLLMDELGWPDYEPESVKRWKAAGSPQWETVKGNDESNKHELYEYNALDCAGTAQLYKILLERADSDNVLRPYRELLVPASNCFAQIEVAGIHYDPIRAADVWENELVPLLKQWTEELRMIVGDNEYNPNSNPQNSKFVYDNMGAIHAMSDRRDKERSVDKAAREEIIAGRFELREAVDVADPASKRKYSLRKRRLQEFASVLHKFKELDKQRSTYIEGLVSKVDADGKIHTDFKIIGTETGRLSSKTPNLQNITRPKSGLPNIRSLFVASDGRTLVSADYSQAELRTIAELSIDPVLRNVYNQGLDLHSITAERFYGSGFTSEQRSNAKNCNFGMFYEQSAETFQEKHGVPVNEAREYIKWAKSEFKRVWQWEAEIKKIVKTGELVTPFGRKKRFHLITRENYRALCREGINFMVQSPAHDLTLWSLIQLHEIFDPDQCQILIEGHDSILFDVVLDYVDESKVIIKEVMESASKKTVNWEVPFLIDITTGERWGELA